MRPGDQVWAKVEGYRWWPATVQDPLDHPEVAARGHGGKERAVVVRFHQTRDLASLPLAKVCDFEENLAEKSQGGKKTGGFAQAVRAAREALEARRRAGVDAGAARGRADAPSAGAPEDETTPGADGKTAATEPNRTANPTANPSEVVAPDANRTEPVSEGTAAGARRRPAAPASRGGEKGGEGVVGKKRKAAPPPEDVDVRSPNPGDPNPGDPNAGDGSKADPKAESKASGAARRVPPASASRRKKSSAAETRADPKGDPTTAPGTNPLPPDEPPSVEPPSVSEPPSEPPSEPEGGLAGGSTDPSDRSKGGEGRGAPPEGRAPAPGGKKTEGGGKKSGPPEVPEDHHPVGLVASTPSEAATPVPPDALAASSFAAKARAYAPATRGTGAAAGPSDMDDAKKDSAKKEPPLDFSVVLRAYFDGAKDPREASVKAALGDAHSEVTALFGRDAAEARRRAARAYGEGSPGEGGERAAGAGDGGDEEKSTLAGASSRRRRDAAVAAAAGMKTTAPKEGARRKESSADPAKGSPDEDPDSSKRGASKPNTKPGAKTTEKAAASSEKPPEKGGALTGAAKKAREKAERAAERAGAHAAKAKERAKSVAAAKSGKSGGVVESSDASAPLDAPFVKKPDGPGKTAAAASDAKHAASFRDASGPLASASAPPLPGVTPSSLLAPSRVLRLREYVLSRSARALATRRFTELEEVRADAETTSTTSDDALDAWVPSGGPGSGWRLFCDACDCAVANLHRSCWACGVDVCAECCGDVRAGRGEVGREGGRGREVAAPASRVIRGIPGATPPTRIKEEGAGAPSSEEARGASRSVSASGPGDGRRLEGNSAALLRGPPKKRAFRTLKAFAADATPRVVVPPTTGDQHLRDVEPSRGGERVGLARTPPRSPSGGSPGARRETIIKPATPTPESTPSAEPLLCAACTRPLDLRSCVDRESLDAVYRDPRVARATEEMMARRAGRGRTRRSPSPSPSRGGGGVKKEDPTFFSAAASDPEAASADPEAASADPEAASADPEAASADPEAASADPFADVRLGGVGTFSAAAESCPRCARAPPSEWRVCSARGSPDARVWTPLWRDVAPASLEKTSSTERLSEPSEERKRPDFFVSAAYAEALAHFQWHWSRGHPVLVRDAEGVGGSSFSRNPGGGGEKNNLSKDAKSNAKDEKASLWTPAALERVAAECLHSTGGALGCASSHRKESSSNKRGGSSKHSKANPKGSDANHANKAGANTASASAGPRVSRDEMMLVRQHGAAGATGAGPEDGALEGSNEGYERFTSFADAVMTPADFFRGFRDASALQSDAIGDAPLFELREWPPGISVRSSHHQRAPGVIGAGGLLKGGGGLLDGGKADPSSLERQRLAARLSAKHRAAAVAAMPFPEYTNPVDGPLNLATALPKSAGRPDPGPEVRAAYGRDEERGVGDCVRRLRVGVADAADALCHVGCDAGERSVGADHLSETIGSGFNAGLGSSLGGGSFSNAAHAHAHANTTARNAGSDSSRGSRNNPVGATWHVFRREDSARLEAFLERRGASLAHRPREAPPHTFLARGAHAHARGGGLTPGRVEATTTPRGLVSPRVPPRPAHTGGYFLTAADLDLLAQDTAAGDDCDEDASDHRGAASDRGAASGSGVSRGGSRGGGSRGGVFPWTIEQRQGDVLLVPAGCPRQSRNRRACVHAALTFCSPESAEAALAASEALREACGSRAGRPGARRRVGEESAHAACTLLHAAKEAAASVRAAERRASEAEATTEAEETEGGSRERIRGGGDEEGTTREKGREEGPSEEKGGSEKEKEEDARKEEEEKEGDAKMEEEEKEGDAKMEEEEEGAKMEEEEEAEIEEDAAEKSEDAEMKDAEESDDAEKSSGKSSDDASEKSDPRPP